MSEYVKIQVVHSVEKKVLEWTPKQDYNNFYARIVGDGLGVNNYVINLHAIAY